MERPPDRTCSLKKRHSQPTITRQRKAGNEYCPLILLPPSGLLPVPPESREVEEKTGSPLKYNPIGSISLGAGRGVG